MIDDLTALKDYVPLLKSIVWPIFILVIVLIFRVQLRNILLGLENRITGGSELKFGNLVVGRLIINTSDLPAEVKTFGDPDELKLLFKAQGKGWKKSTKALELPHGCLIQVTTERQSRDADWANAEALAFIPNVALLEQKDKTWKIVPKEEEQ